MEVQRLWCLNLHKHRPFKLAVVVLLTGVTFTLLFHLSERFEPNLEHPFLDETQLQSSSISPNSYPNLSSADEAIEKAVNEEKCDPFTGKWIPEPLGPRYTNKSCSFIEDHQNCMKNGRPDSGFLYWKWKPTSCELPPFDAQRFLDLMRNKTWAFIGDSLSRNHVQSLICILSSVEQATEVYNDKEFKSKTWRFPSYNLTISNIWSPFLVKAAIFEHNDGAEIQLQLDKLDTNWTDAYRRANYAVLATGKWYYRAAIYQENNTIVGCHLCPGKNLTEQGFDFAYRKALRTVMDFVATSNHKGLIFYRASTPDHYENGEWHNGGNCPKTMPVEPGKIELNDLNRILHDIELAEFERVSARAYANGVKFKLLDFSYLLLLRPDGHPGPFREFQPFTWDRNDTLHNDCVHWCLPGPIDYWNDVMMEMVVNG